MGRKEGWWRHWKTFRSEEEEGAEEEEEYTRRHASFVTPWFSLLVVVWRAGFPCGWGCNAAGRVSSGT